MIIYSKKVLSDWPHVEKLSAQEYTRYLRQCIHDRDLYYWNEEGTGIRAFVDTEGDLIFKIEDSKAYRRTLTSDTGHTPPTNIGTAGMNASLSIKRFRKQARSLAKEILPWTGKHVRRLSKVVIDLIPKHPINAGACPVPSGGDAIMISEGFHHLPLWHIWNIVSAQSPDIWDGLVPRNGFRIFAIAKLVLGRSDDPFTELNDTWSNIDDMISSNDLDRNYVRELAKMRTYATLIFVILHEFGHVALGHTDISRTWRDRFDELPEEERQKRCELMHRFEYAADRFAVDVICERRPHLPLADDQEAIVLERFLIDNLSEITNDFFTMTGLGDEEFLVHASSFQKASHPSSENRQRAVIKHLHRSA